MNIVQQDKRGSSQAAQSFQRDESRSALSRANIGTNSMQKLTGGASRAQLIPQADMNNEI